MKPSVNPASLILWWQKIPVIRHHSGVNDGYVVVRVNGMSMLEAYSVSAYDASDFP